ncbi:MAG TPA: rod shape-determining protein RodA [Saprospiraceae bacterium]|nr:rod shape-determining protein RodA [Saprospiraceae bacterium]HPI08591.1 rod shape-determining protein RodA [Saprospiraceae bacterium]
MITGTRQISNAAGGADLLTLGLYVALVIIGWLMIFAVNYDPNAPFSFFDLSNNTGKQLFFMVVCFALIFVIMMSDWAFWRTFAFFIYLFSLILLPGTLIFGREINGAYAWYQIGGFSLQPAEIAKFGTCLAMSAYLSSTGVDLREWRSRIIAMGIFLVPAIIMSPLIQNDTGSALVFFSFMMVLYREGLSPTWYLVGFGITAMVLLGLVFDPPFVVAWLLAFTNFRLISRFRTRTQVWLGVWLALVLITIWWTPIFNWVLAQAGVDPATGVDEQQRSLAVMVPHFILFAATFLPNYLKKNSLVQSHLRTWLLMLSIGIGLVFAANFACYTLLAPHQQQRIKIWLKPGEAAADARGAAYNLLHSKMAIGSGGFGGKGFLDGNMTKLKYVPEQSTDFIFCTIGEEQGFIGVAAIIVVFFWLLYRITVLAERQRSNFSRVYAYCVAGVLFIHVLVNVGMTMGLFPIIGIPLPFISYGGSSLIGFTLMIGVLLKLDSNRNLA